MPSSPTLSRARMPGRLPVLRWSRQGRGGTIGGGSGSLHPMESRFLGESSAKKQARSSCCITRVPGRCK